MDQEGLVAGLVLIAASLLSLTLYRRAMDDAEQQAWLAGLLLGMVGVAIACG